MRYIYPNPQALGLKIPPTLRADRITRGFDHALRGGYLDNIEYFRLSFCFGFHTAKRSLRKAHWRRGILNFPMRARFRQKVIW